MFSKKVHQTLPKEERSRGFNSKLNSLMPQSHTHSCSHPRSCRREEERKKSRERESKWGESESESGGRLICQRWKLGKGWRTRLSVCRCLWREDYSKLQSVLSDIKHSCRLESDLSHTLPYWNMSSCWRLLFFVLLFFFLLHLASLTSRSSSSWMLWPVLSFLFIQSVTFKSSAERWEMLTPPGLLCEIPVPSLLSILAYIILFGVKGVEKRRGV